jgi:hypothetical protein
MIATNIAATFFREAEHGILGFVRTYKYAVNRPFQFARVLTRRHSLLTRELDKVRSGPRATVNDVELSTRQKVLSAAAEWACIVEGVDLRTYEVVAGREARRQGDVRPSLVGNEVLRAPGFYSIWLGCVMSRVGGVDTNW